MNIPTQEKLLQILSYDKDTGVFVRILKTSNAASLGVPLGMLAASRPDGLPKSSRTPQLPQTSGNHCLPK